MPTPRRANKKAAEPKTSALEELLRFLHASRGFDFTGYKRSTLQRRIDKRMAAIGIDDYASYRDQLEVDPDEFAALFDTILINVTGFFRDRPAWEFVSETVIPRLLAERDDGRPIRVWNAGCATGEEAYTAAIALAEALGDEQFRRRVKIYGTDVDEDALSIARQAVYPAEAVKAIPDGLLDRYFERKARGFTFRSDLRRSMIFGRNDLMQDAPISQIDLLSSRNVLMYFTAEAQTRILERFNFAMTEAGYLFLGKSEMLITHGDLFTPFDLRWRVFQKVPSQRLRTRLAFVGVDGSSIGGDSDRFAELRAGAIALAPVAQMIVDDGGFVVEANKQARDLFDIVTADIGRPFQDLTVSYRPTDLRSALEKARTERTMLLLQGVHWQRADGDERVLEITVTPIPGPAGVALGASLSFQDVTLLTRINEENDRRKRELENAYEELQSTVEELETTNEELQSTNEELETTNEELQSTNEELETTNEELQSANDELETINSEQLERGGELDRVNLLLEGILGSLGVGVAVVDNDRVVQLWNAESQELWGLRPDEAEGRRLAELDIGLPLDELQTAVDTALRDQESAAVTVDAVNRRGRGVSCLVRVIPMRHPDGEPSGAIVVTSAPPPGGQDGVAATP